MRKNLVLVHTPGREAVEDWHEIAGLIRDMADDIAVFVVDNETPDPAQVEEIAERPTLVFSQASLRGFQPPRGRVWEARYIPVFEQLQRLAAAKVPVPPTAILEPGMILDPAFWGPAVILKATRRRSGNPNPGIELVRTEKVRYRPPEDYPEDHPGRNGPMLVQGYVYTGPQLPHFRILLLFGEPLYAQEKRIRMDPAVLRRMPSMMAENHSFPPELVEYRFVDDKRVLRMARKVAATFPEAPLHAVDIVRQQPTGRLYVLETNPGGNTWEFSDQLVKRHLPVDPDIVRKRKEQFDAFGTAARVLVERTRAEAC